MKTVRLSSLVGCILLALSASAFADMSVAKITGGVSRAPRLDRKICYTNIGGGVPQPCDRFMGPIATTASPIDIYGRKPQRSR